MNILAETDRQGAIARPPWGELALLGLLALLWGSSYLLIKVALDTIPPVTLIAVRVSIAAMLLLLVMAWRQQSLPRDTSTWRALLVQAILNSIAAWTLLAWGQQYVGSGLGSVLNSTAPIFVFLITYFYTRHEATNGLRLLGACLGLVGVALIIGVDVLAGLGRQVVAQLAILAGSLLYAGAAIYGKRFAGQSPVVTAAGTMLWASAVLIPAALIFEQPWTQTPSMLSMAAAGTLGVFCTGLALLLYFRLLKTLGSLGVASQAYLRSCVGVLLGIALLGEQVSLVVGLGLAAAIVGVAAINMPVRKRV